MYLTIFTASVSGQYLDILNILPDTTWNIMLRELLRTALVLHSVLPCEEYKPS